MKYEEVDGDLIVLAKQGYFDVICHGVNCMCIMGAGIAPQMAAAFGCDKFPLEDAKYKGDINKLGQIDYKLNTSVKLTKDGPDFGGIHTYIVNTYTQYNYGRNHKDGDKIPFDYNAFTICMKKINHIFKGFHVGLPMIGCGLAGADWNIVQRIIKKELRHCDVTIVKYKK